MRRTIRNRTRKPELTEAQILEWADLYFKKNGFWPRQRIPPCSVLGEFDTTWSHIDDALRRGLRGLEAGSSLARLLAAHRGVRNQRALPKLTIERILSLADAFRHRTGEWPGARNFDEMVDDTSGDKWMYIELALQNGLRGLPGGSSIAQLLAEHRGMRNRGHLPGLTEQQILVWADQFFERTGRWPTAHEPSPIEGSNGERWVNIGQCLRKGLRGLPGGTSLSRLLKSRRS